jgi:hypothetical protein
MCTEEGGEALDSDMVEKAGNSLVYLRPRPFGIRGSRLGAPIKGVVMWQATTSNIPTLHFPKVVHAFDKFRKDEDLEKYVYSYGIGAHACAPARVSGGPSIRYNEMDPKIREKARELIPKMMNIMTGIGVTPHYLGRARGPSSVLWKLGEYYELLRTIKRTLDPNNIMNPGLLYMPEF